MLVLDDFLEKRLLHYYPVTKLVTSISVWQRYWTFDNFIACHPFDEILIFGHRFGVHIKQISQCIRAKIKGNGSFISTKKWFMCHFFFFCRFLEEVQGAVQPVAWHKSHRILKLAIDRMTLARNLCTAFKALFWLWLRLEMSSRS